MFKNTENKQTEAIKIKKLDFIQLHIFEFE